MTARDCGQHEEEMNKLYRWLLIGAAAFIGIILLIIFLIWLILRPSKPSFVLQDITVYTFNISSPNLITSNLQVTLSTKNPNDRIGVYYATLDVYVSYRNQQITLPTELPPTYQGHKDIVVWSPFLYGASVPVAPYLGVALNEDQMTGMVLVNIKVNGRIKWKVGTWISGHYHLYVNCPAYISFGNRNTGIAVGPAVKLQLVQSCSVDV